MGPTIPEPHPWSTWPAPAKLNLFLKIIGRREDGYHRLQTVFRLLDWGDCLRFRLRDDGMIIRTGPSIAGLAPDDDLSVRAAKLLRRSANVAKGADIIVEKKIPTGGGFGGGSSDAATTLVALNALWELRLPLAELAALGLQLGADVPVFVHGDNAWAEGIGEQLTPLTLPPAWYVMVDPGVHAASATLFQSSELTRDAPPVTIADFVSGVPLGNAFEPILRAREPVVEAAFAALSQVGSPRLTGSGSGCFVEFATRESAESALSALPPGLNAWLAAGVQRSPLHVALETNNALLPQGRRQEAQGTRF